MGVKIAIGSVVYVLVAAGVSWRLWDCLSGGEFSTSAVIRNLVLIWGAPLATVLAVWRSMVAQDQAKTAQRGLLSDRYQRAVEMLGHKLVAVRIGGIHALRDIAIEHSDKYLQGVRILLSAYSMGTGENVKFTPPDGKEINRLPDEWEAGEAIKEIEKHIPRPSSERVASWWKMK